MMSSEDPRIALSIVIPTWNTRDLVHELLLSLEAHPPHSAYEVIVIDNGSSDGTADLVRTAFPSTKLLVNSENTGYARANNQGWAVARGENILLLGSDTQMLEGTLDAMLDYLRGRLTVGAVACRLMGYDGEVQKSCRRFPRVWDAALTYLSLHALARRYNYAGLDYFATQEVDQPPGTCLMIRRKVIQDVGLFDERFTILYNDVDLCRRIWRAGWKIVYIGSAAIRHRGSFSTRRTPPALRLEMYRNILRYFFRDAGIGAVVCLLPILFIRLCFVNRGRSVLGLLSFDYLRQ